MLVLTLLVILTLIVQFRDATSASMCVQTSDSLTRSGAIRHGDNLQGMVITAVMGASVRYDLTDEWTEAYIELWTHLATHLNFTLKVRELDSRLPESSWMQLLSEVQSGSAQVSLAPILMLPSTSLNITLSAPLHQTRFSVLVRGGASGHVRWNSFLQPFGTSLWIVMLTSVIVLSLSLAVMWKTETSKHMQESLPCVSLSEALICVLGAACMQGHASPPRSTSARWVHLTALMSAVIIVAVYSSSVTAFLAVTREDKPFSTLTQLLSHSRYRPFTLMGSPEYTVFQESLYPALVRHRAKTPPSALPSLSTALLVTCGRNTSLLGRWSSRVPALVIPSLWADRVLATAPCKLTHFALTDSTEQQMWAAFPISTKLQPFTRIINQRLRRMHETGSILRWSVQISRRASHAQQEEDTTDASRFSVSLKDIIPLLALLGFGAAISISLLVLETLIKFLLI